ncbi:hypothetical protein DY000_02018305 [Brassica cretica]|uniref:Uncharacterized protein n=1 Tax=Brassica cretica TaxID=69181 RepID=A0ABQ7D979_BRACR|nr:hypothetical protein DY000_02018305 [Brassica cretica]
MLWYAFCLIIGAAIRLFPIFGAFVCILPDHWICNSAVFCLWKRWPKPFSILWQMMLSMEVSRCEVRCEVIYKERRKGIPEGCIAIKVEVTKKDLLVGVVVINVNDGNRKDDKQQGS